MTEPVRPDHRIRQVLRSFGFYDDAAVTRLADLKREIYQYGKGRCDVEASRDNLKYYIGAAFEVNYALDLDSLALTGLLAMPSDQFSAIFADLEELPQSVIEILQYALGKPPVRKWCRAKGVWLEWQRLRVIYQQEVGEFRASEAFARPGWRRRPVTRAQHYLMGEIHRILCVPLPVVTNRGQAYEFIASCGGNPRFLVEPPPPPYRWGA